MDNRALTYRMIKSLCAPDGCTVIVERTETFDHAV